MKGDKEKMSMTEKKGKLKEFAVAAWWLFGYAGSGIAAWWRASNDNLAGTLGFLAALFWVYVASRLYVSADSSHWVAVECQKEMCAMKDAIEAARSDLWKAHEKLKAYAAAETKRINAEAAKEADSVPCGGSHAAVPRSPFPISPLPPFPPRQKGRRLHTMGLKEIAKRALAEVFAADAALSDLERHDAKYHGGHYDGKAQCKYREALANGDDADMLDPENVAGEVAESDANVAANAATITALGKIDKAAKGMKGNVAALILANAKAALNGKPTMPLPPVGSPSTAAPAPAKKKRTRKASAQTSAPSAPGTEFRAGHPALDISAADFPNPADFDFANYGDSSAGWKTVGSGSTAPHKKTINGVTYYVKKAGVNPTYSVEAATNERNANRFIRLAGFNAPESEIYTTPDGTFCVTREVPHSGQLVTSHLSDPAVVAQLREFYPIAGFMYNTDILKNDNAFLDANGELALIDNGSAFGYAAQGQRKYANEIDKRTDPQDIFNLGLHRAQTEWREVFGNANMMDDVAKYDWAALAKEAKAHGLFPKKSEAALMQFAQNLAKDIEKYKKAMGR